MYVKWKDEFTTDNPPGAPIWEEVQNIETIAEKDGNDDKKSTLYNILVSRTEMHFAYTSYGITHILPIKKKVPRRGCLL